MTMKKPVSLILIISLLALTLVSCTTSDIVVLTCDDVISAYKAAGYHVSHFENHTKEDSYDSNCYVRVWLDDEYECVYFHFFDTAEAAEAYNEDSPSNIGVLLFSIIFGDPTLLITKTYNNIQYEYELDCIELIKPFKELIN